MLQKTLKALKLAELWWIPEDRACLTHQLLLSKLIEQGVVRGLYWASYYLFVLLKHFTCWFSGMGMLRPICWSAILLLRIINWCISCRWAKCQAHFNTCSGIKCSKHIYKHAGNNELLISSMCFLKRATKGTFGLLPLTNTFILSYLCGIFLFSHFQRKGKAVFWVIWELRPLHSHCLWQLKITEFPIHFQQSLSLCRNT